MVKENGFIYTSTNPDWLMSYCNKNGIWFYPGGKHYTCAEEESKFLINLIKKGTSFALWDTIVMDYLPIEQIMLVEENEKVVSFAEKFKEELEYLYPGEVLQSQP